MNDFGRASDVDKRRASGDLPPLAAEDHECDECRLRYPDISIDQACAVIGGLTEQLRAATAPLPDPVLRQQPAAGQWSVIEYACHLRDVFISYTIRLYRTRTEDRPAFEPMFNDLRAKRFRYQQAGLTIVVDGLAIAAGGFVEEVGHVRDDGWDRTGTRLPDEERTARWLVRQAMHEGVHHLADIRRVAAAVSEPGTPSVSEPGTPTTCGSRRP